MSTSLTQRPLTAQQKTDRLLAKLRTRCLELQYGTLDLLVKVHEGHIVQIDCQKRSETWKVD